MPLQCVRFVKMSTKIFFFYQITLDIVLVRLGKQARILSEKKGVFSSVGVTTMVLPSLKKLKMFLRLF